MKTYLCIFLLKIFSPVLRTGLKISQTLYKHLGTDCVVLVQSKDYIVKNQDGIPVDRPFWYFLPFLGADRGKTFQPQEEGGKKVYKIPSWLL